MLTRLLTRYLITNSINNINNLIEIKTIKLSKYVYTLNKITADLNLNQQFKSGATNLLSDLISKEQKEINYLVMKLHKSNINLIRKSLLPLIFVFVISSCALYLNPTNICWLILNMFLANTVVGVTTFIKGYDTER